MELVGPRKMCGSFLWKLRQGREAVGLLGKRPLFLAETYVCCSWMGSSESMWNYRCSAKKNTHTNKHSVFKKRSETESSQSTEHLSQMVASDYCFKKTSLRIQNFIWTGIRPLDYLKKHLMNVETNALWPESFKPVYSVMKIYVSTFMYEMVVFYLSYHFQYFLRYPPSTE